jgi:hypothetical protein
MRHSIVRLGDEIASLAGFTEEDRRLDKSMRHLANAISVFPESIYDSRQAANNE